MIDIRALKRDLAAEAIDGVLYQLQGAIRFLDRGEDAQAHAAMSRAAHFFREAAKPLNELIADHGGQSKAALVAAEGGTA